MKTLNFIFKDGQKFTKEVKEEHAEHFLKMRCENIDCDNCELSDNVCEAGEKPDNDDELFANELCDFANDWNKGPMEKVEDTFDWEKEREKIIAKYSKDLGNQCGLAPSQKQTNRFLSELIIDLEIRIMKLENS